MFSEIREHSSNSRLKDFECLSLVSRALSGVPAAEGGDESTQYLFETQLHAEMRAFESQPFIKPVRILA